MFQPMQLVITDEKWRDGTSPWNEERCLLFLGEIKQMPGHCAVVDGKGNVYWGWHTDRFREPTEDEV